MSDVGKRVIWVGPADGANDKPLNQEGVAITGTIFPGNMLQQQAAGLALSATLSDRQQVPLVADKDQQRTKSVDDAWTITENMVAIQPRSGEFCNVLVAPNQNILSLGAPLIRTQSGTLTLATNGPQEYLTAAINASGGSTYLLNDVLTISGGTFTTPATALVTAVTAGAIDSVILLSGGIYSAIPVSLTGLATTGGGGTGATVDVTADLITQSTVAFSDEVLATPSSPSTGTLVRVRFV